MVNYMSIIRTVLTIKHSLSRLVSGLIFINLHFIQTRVVQIHISRHNKSLVSETVPAPSTNLDPSVISFDYILYLMFKNGTGIVPENNYTLRWVASIFAIIGLPVSNPPQSNDKGIP